jgi:hypothetical protein
MTSDMTHAIPPAATSRRFPTFDPSSKEDVDAARYAHQFAEVTTTAKAVAAAVATKEAEMEAAVSAAVAAGKEAALAKTEVAVSAAVAAEKEAALAKTEAAVSAAAAELQQKNEGAGLDEHTRIMNRKLQEGKITREEHEQLLKAHKKWTTS